MGIFEKLNELSNKMNEVADKVCGNLNGNMENIAESVNNTINGVDNNIIEKPSIRNGLEGLGVLNTKNSSAYLETPYGYLVKTDTDKRKLATDYRRFKDTTDYRRYLEKYISSINSFEVSNALVETVMELNYHDVFTCHYDNEEFCVCVVLDYTDIDRILMAVSTSETLKNKKKVIIGFFNYSNEMKNMASNNCVEFIGTSDIHDINDAVDLADKNLPYLGLGKGTLKHKLSSTLNNSLRQRVES